MPGEGRGRGVLVGSVGGLGVYLVGSYELGNEKPQQK